VVFPALSCPLGTYVPRGLSCLVPLLAA